MNQYHPQSNTKASNSFSTITALSYFQELTSTPAAETKQYLKILEYTHSLQPHCTVTPCCSFRKTRRKIIFDLLLFKVMNIQCVRTKSSSVLRKTASHQCSQCSCWQTEILIILQDLKEISSRNFICKDTQDLKIHRTYTLLTLLWMRAPKKKKTAV